MTCLAGAAALWAWALWPRGPGSAPALPEGLAGRYEFVRLVPGPDAAPGAGAGSLSGEGRFELRADGTYRRTVLSGGREIARMEGRLAADGDALTFTQVSENRTLRREPPQVYRVSWKTDPEGRLLVLRHDGDGHEILLRPLPADEVSSAR